MHGISTLHLWQPGNGVRLQDELFGKLGWEIVPHFESDQVSSHFKAQLVYVAARWSFFMFFFSVAVKVVTAPAPEVLVTRGVCVWDRLEGPASLCPLPREVPMGDGAAGPTLWRSLHRGRYPPPREPRVWCSEPTAAAGVPTQEGAFLQPRGTQSHRDLGSERLDTSFLLIVFSLISNTNFEVQRFFYLAKMGRGYLFSLLFHSWQGFVHGSGSQARVVRRQRAVRVPLGSRDRGGLRPAQVGAARRVWRHCQHSVRLCRHVNPEGNQWVGNSGLHRTSV